MPTRSPLTSERLIRRAQEGDSSAVNSLIRRHMPSLHKWAHGRMPRWLRTMADTTDLVQNALLQTFRRINSFEPRGHRALSAYLRQAVVNQIRDEHRRFKRRGPQMEVPEDLVDPTPSPFEHAAGVQVEERYLAALQRLKESDRELLVAHVELGYTHDQLGCMTGRTANAARVALTRALERLAEEMQRG